MRCRSVTSIRPRAEAITNVLLDQLGYRKGGDGYRTLADGKPLLLHYSSQTDATARDADEFWKKTFDTISIRRVIDKGKCNDQSRRPSPASTRCGARGRALTIRIATTSCSCCNAPTLTGATALAIRRPNAMPYIERHR
jgi:hypothetical protein